jgi:hypothetical protein
VGLPEGKTSITYPSAKEETRPVAEVEKKLVEPAATTSALSEPEPKKVAVPTPSADSSANLAAKMQTSKQLQAETREPGSGPSRNNLAEESLGSGASNASSSVIFIESASQKTWRTDPNFTGPRRERGFSSRLQT